MSEHIVLVPLLFSLIIYAKKDQSTLDLLIIGILLGISSMIRSNIILPAILITFSTLLFNSHFSLKKKIFDIFLISTGGLLVLIFCLLPFLYTDSLDLFLMEQLQPILKKDLSYQYIKMGCNCSIKIC